MRNVYILNFVINVIMNTFSSDRCIVCKGSDPVRYCGKTFCPIYAKAEAMFKVKDLLDKEDFLSSSPAPFVGRFGYPNVSVGILTPPEQSQDAWLYDAPRFWSAQDFQINKIVDLRSALINSRFKINIKKINKFLQVSQEVGMASKPVDLEVKLDKKPKFKLSFSPEVAPMGPHAKLEKVEITSNPKISHKVERVVGDTDLKANDALVYLYKSGFDENFLSKLLSVGSLGLKFNRRLVPTRYSITAIDDALGKHLIDKIKSYEEIDYLLYFGGYLGNYFLIMFFPRKWSYELFETYLPRASWNICDEVRYSTDFEFYEGRKDYAENCGGGYYANRLPVLEKFEELKKQGTVLSIRFISGEYFVPLGVFVVREATRKALSTKPLNFGSMDLMLKYAKALIKKKFNFDISVLLQQSKTLKMVKTQLRLGDFV